MSKDAKVEQSEKGVSEPRASSSAPEATGDLTSHGGQRSPAPGFGRWSGDWLLLAALFGALPLMCLLAIDLWTRTDLLFFSACFLVSAIWIAVRTRFSSHQDHRRSRWTIGLWCVGTVTLGLAVFLFSPWFGLLGMTLILLGWMLYRCGQVPWYRLLARTIPLFLLLALPVSDASDATRGLERASASSAGVFLDLLGVPNLVDGRALELRSGELSTSQVCRGLGNPYLLLAAVVGLALLTSRSVLVGVLLTISVPFWAWLGATLYTVVGVYLLEEQNRNLFIGYRGLGVQLGILVVLLLAVWLTALALRNFLAPFTAYSTTAGGFHKFYNWCVLWPVKDPLRTSRRSLKAENDQYAIDFLQHRLAAPVQFVVMLVLLALAGISGYQWLGLNWTSRMQPLEFASTEASPLLAADDMPVQFEGLQQIGFESVDRSSAYFSRKHAGTWAYLDKLQKVEFQVELPYRGNFPVEQEYFNSETRFDQIRQSYSVAVEGLGDVEMDQVILSDSINGRTFLAYTTVSLNEFPPLRTWASEGRFSASLFARSCALQPTVVTVRMVVVGSERPTEEEAERRRQLLLKATELIVQSLRE